MKTIEIHFNQGETHIATVTGKFSSVPGTGPIQWYKKSALEALLQPPYTAPLPDKVHYADLFQDAMVALAERHGLRWEVNTSGEWTVHEE